MTTEENVQKNGIRKINSMDILEVIASLMNFEHCDNFQVNMEIGDKWIAFDIIFPCACSFENAKKLHEIADFIDGKIKMIKNIHSDESFYYQINGCDSLENKQIVLHALYVMTK